MLTVLCLCVTCSQSPWGCCVCPCVPWAGLWCTGHHWAALSLPGLSRTSVTSGLWFSQSWQSSLWPRGKNIHTWLQHPKMQLITQPLEGKPQIYDSSTSSKLPDDQYLSQSIQYGVLCVDSQFGGVSTDCDSTPGFLLAPASAGLCPRTRAGLTASSASQSANTFNASLKALLIMAYIR